jgi:hypothetical protein
MSGKRDKKGISQVEYPFYMWRSQGLRDLAGELFLDDHLEELKGLRPD